MLQIAIIEDEADLAQQTKDNVVRYLNEHGLEGNIAVFNDGMDIVLIATACFAVFSILPSENKDNEFRIGVVENQLIYWMTLVISILGAYLFFRIIRSNAETKKQMESLITAALFVSVLCGMGHFLST